MVVSGASWEADRGRHGPLGLVIRDCLKGGSLCIASHVPIDIKMAARNLVYDGLKGVLIRFRTEDDDIATRLASFLLRVELLTIYAERECKMAARKDKAVLLSPPWQMQRPPVPSTSKWGVVRGAIWRPIAGVNGTRTPVVGYRNGKSE